MMLKVAIALLLVLILFSIFMVVLGKGNTKEKAKLNKRIASIASLDLSLQNAQVDAGVGKRGATSSRRLHTTLRTIGARLEKIRPANTLDERMQQAGWPMLGSEFQAIMAGCGLIVGLLTGLLTLSPIHVVLGFIVGVVGCLMALTIRIQRRQKAFADQLEDMLNMTANALRAGFSFMQALDYIANEMADPVRSEVRRVVTDVNMGLPLEESLNNMTRRVNSPDFNLVVTAVLIQRQVGGNLARVLDTISGTINDRIRMRREVNTLTAQGKMSAWVVGGLPIFIGIVMQIIMPGYLDPIFTSEIGQIAAAVCAVLMLIGFIIIRSIVNIEL